LLGRRRESRGVPGTGRARSAPTLILWGNEDRWVPLEQAELFAAAIPGSRTIVLAALRPHSLRKNARSRTGR
jgi:pimeloyl-ACP methyl ester carboxylesterase